VGLPKNQPNFRKELIIPEPVSSSTLSLIDERKSVELQNGVAEGPKFDFSSSEVLIAENQLRQSVINLKAMLETHTISELNKTSYAELTIGLNQLMPKLYLDYDAFVSAVITTGEEKVTCSRACSHCCSHYVTSVEPYELIFLHDKIRTNSRYPDQIMALHKRVTQFKGLLKGGVEDMAQVEDEDRALYRYYLRGQPCPFLTVGGSCGVYANRPMSCRMFFSLSHPSLCKGKSVISPGNRNFLIELPEDIEANLARAGALFSHLDFPESLFEGLLAVNQELGQFDESV
jgi:Fe-S-cluster containining protein